MNINSAVSKDCFLMKIYVLLKAPLFAELLRVNAFSPAHFTPLEIFYTPVNSIKKSMCSKMLHKLLPIRLEHPFLLSYFI
jgi:hypothetical protein